MNFLSGDYCRNNKCQDNNTYNVNNNNLFDGLIINSHLLLLSTILRLIIN